MEKPKSNIADEDDDYGDVYVINHSWTAICEDEWFVEQAKAIEQTFWDKYCVNQESPLSDYLDDDDYE